LVVGGPVTNAGILAFACEPAPQGGARVFVRCAGPAGAKSVSVEIDRSRNGVDWIPVAGLEADLNEAGEGTVVLALDEVPEDRALRARLARGDALEADDTAWAVWPGERTPVAYYYTGRPGNVARALQAAPGLRVDLRETAAGRAAPADAAARLAVYDGVAPERLPEGRWVALINPPSSVPPFEVGAPESAVPGAWAAAAPLTDHVDLQAIRVWRARPCRFTGDAASLQTIVGGSTGPILAVWRRPGGAVLYAGFDPTWRGDAASGDSAWALDPGFAIFWKNVIDAVYSETGVRAGLRWRSGRTCEPAPLAHGAVGPFRGPDGLPAPDAGAESIGPVIHRAGLIVTPGGAPAGAASVFDADETACRSGGPSTGPGASGTDPAAFRLPPPAMERRARSYAPVFAAAAGLALVAAWMIGRRQD
jgi:hypothetical protein